MAKNKGNLLSCLTKLIHHVAPHKVALMFGVGCTEDDLSYRFNLIRTEAEIVKQQIIRIKEVAERKNYEEVLNIINEELEYGHDL